MIVVVDERQLVLDGYSALFAREGIPVAAVMPDQLASFIEDIADEDLSSIDAFMLGQGEHPGLYPIMIKKRCDIPILWLTEAKSVDEILLLFDFGADDVLRKPIHVREILARIGAIKRRKGSIRQRNAVLTLGALCVFNDGRDPKINGEDFPLPRRERRILEFLAANHAKRVHKSQIFNAVYGALDTEVEESVVESHISKLRKKLKKHFGYDVIDSKRYLGYRLIFKDL